MTANTARRSRWALSFADLSLLLVGFFVLMQANSTQRDAALQGIGAQFGAIRAPTARDFPGAMLFVPGEALLTPAGRASLAAIARQAGDDGVIEIQSFGMDRSLRRFDAWDLSAARLGAAARALREAGISEQRLRIAGLAETPDAKADTGQTIRLVIRPSARP